MHAIAATSRAPGPVVALVLVAAPLALNVPLSVLAGVLLFVAWNRGEWHEFVKNCGTAAFTIV